MNKRVPGAIHERYTNTRPIVPSITVKSFYGGVRFLNSYARLVREIIGFGDSRS
jgi:hypothetical protein